MKYITGYYALNTQCSLDTTGDWHRCCINWNKVEFFDSNKMFFKDWGIEKQYIKELDSEFFVANHIRACLDLLELGKYSTVQGVKNDYLDDNDKFNNIFIKKVLKMKKLENWPEIEKLMKKEYRLKWLEVI